MSLHSGAVCCEPQQPCKLVASKRGSSDLLHGSVACAIAPVSMLHSSKACIVVAACATSSWPPPHHARASVDGTCARPTQRLEGGGVIYGGARADL